MTLCPSRARFQLYYSWIIVFATQEGKDGPLIAIASNHQPDVIINAVTIEVSDHMERNRDSRPGFLPVSDVVGLPWIPPGSQQILVGTLRNGDPHIGE
jgi:hypothetical protein